MTGLTGKTIGHYRIMEKLGHGGMAEVYRGYHANLDRYVAIKFIRTELAENEDFQTRFEREARTAARLTHPHIVLIHDSGHEDNLYYLVMEFIDGMTLKQLLLAQQKKGERLPLSDVVRLMQQVGSALDCAHDQNVVHRDVKPDNILIRTDGRAVLSDFGIARMVDDTSGLTMTGTTMGTPTYMSPEQIKGDKEKVGRGSDLYSLGIILYEMLLGQVPFQADTPFAVMLKHVNDPIPLPTEVDPRISDEVQRVIFKTLSKEPKDRYQNAETMVAELSHAISAMPHQTVAHQIQQTAPIQALDTIISSTAPPVTAVPADTIAISTSPTADPVEDATEVMPTPQPIDEEPPGKRKWVRRTLMGLGAALLIAIVAVIAIVINQNNSQNPQQVLFNHGAEGVFLINAIENDVPESLSDKLDNQFDLDGVDYEFGFSQNGNWFVGHSTRSPKCASWACMVVIRNDFAQGGIVRIDNQPLHDFETSTINNSGDQIVYSSEATDENVRDLVLITLVDKENDAWEIQGTLTEESPYEWNTYPEFSGDEEKVVFMCGDEPYGGSGTAICEYNIAEEHFRVLMTPEEHSLRTNEGTGALFYPYYDKNNVVHYSDSDVYATWYLEEVGDDEVVINYLYERGSECILPNGLLVVVEWGEEDMPLLFIDSDTKEERFRVQSGFSGNDIYGFSCSGG